MSRKVYIELKMRLVLSVDEGVDISEALNEMYYEVTPADFHADKVTVLDTEIRDYEIVDSK